MKFPVALRRTFTRNSWNARGGRWIFAAVGTSSARASFRSMRQSATRALSVHAVLGARGRRPLIQATVIDLPGSSERAANKTCSGLFRRRGYCCRFSSERASGHADVRRIERQPQCPRRASIVNATSLFLSGTRGELARAAYPNNGRSGWRAWLRTRARTGDSSALLNHPMHERDRTGMAKSDRLISWAARLVSPHEVTHEVVFGPVLLRSAFYAGRCPIVRVVKQQLYLEDSPRS
jgi:hypothetical protein